MDNKASKACVNLDTNNNITEKLEKIITLSHLILQNLVLETPNNEPDSQSGSNGQQDTLNWGVEREALIKSTFNQQQAVHYAENLSLINEIVALDNKLKVQAQEKKLALKASLLNMKKNQKAASSYKKY